jgi:hypothetical protein
MTTQDRPKGMPSIKPIYEQGLEAEKIVDLVKTNALILESLREKNIPIVEDAALIRWHYREPPANEAEAQAIDAVNRFARTGELSEIVDSIGKHNARYLYWHSGQYGEFPFGAVVNGQVCCAMNDDWLLNFQNEKICSYVLPRISDWKTEEVEHLLVIYK